MKFEKLSEAKILALIAELEGAAIPDKWDNWHKAHSQEAMIEFPLGELFNGAIAGFLFAWKLQNRISTAKIEEADRFNAQGLEGKCRVVTTLVTALLAYRELPRFRRQLRIAA
jgi:hypothetical protein